MLKDEPRLSEYRVTSITQAVMAKYPAMATWGQPFNGRILSWADLMFLESAVMSGAMRKLMFIDKTPSLCVHDSLIVPVSKAEIAREAITMAFHAKHRVQPLLKTNPPTNAELTETLAPKTTREGGLMVMNDCRRTQVHRERFLFMTDWSMFPPCASRRPEASKGTVSPSALVIGPRSTGIPEEATGSPQTALRRQTALTETAGTGVTLG